VIRWETRRVLVQHVQEESCKSWGEAGRHLPQTLAEPPGGALGAQVFISNCHRSAGLEQQLHELEVAGSDR
jgi:hypothetical protein